MSKILFGIGLAALASIMFNLGLVLQKEGAVRLPKIRCLNWSTARGFLTARLWMLGTGITLGGYVFEFISFALAPFVLVQPIFSAGIVTLAFFAVIIAGERLSILEWGGVVIAIAGALMVAFSASTSIDEVSREAIHPDRLILALLLAGIGGILVNLLARRLGAHSEVLFGLSAGLAFTGTEILTKLLGLEGPELIGLSGKGIDLWSLLTLILLLVAYGLLGTYLLQIGFQHGRALVIGGVMGLSADILPIISGLVVFGEQMPQSLPRLWVRIIGILGAVTGALVITFSPSTEHFMEQLEQGTLHVNAGLPREAGKVDVDDHQHVAEGNRAHE